MTFDDFILTLAMLLTLALVFLPFMAAIEWTWKRWETWNFYRRFPAYNYRNGKYTRL